MPATPATLPERYVNVAPDTPRVVHTYSLLVGDELIRLEPGTITLGRSSDSDIVLDTAQVSRRHARLLISTVGVVIEDLQSMNGVYVNGERIRVSRSIDEGDVLRIGGMLLKLRAGHRVSSSAPRAAQPVPPMPARSETPAPTTRPGRRTDAFNELARLSDRMISMGRPEVATRLVSERLHSLLDALRSGHDVSVPMLESATWQALRIALASKAPAWVDLAVELNLLAKRPMNDDAIELLTRALKKLPDVDAAMFFYYQQMLHAELEQYGPFDRLRADRLLQLRASS